MEHAVALFGSFDENIKLIEQHYGVDVTNRGSDIRVSGDVEAVDKATRAINGLLELINRGEQPGEQNVRYVMMLVDEDGEAELPRLSSDSITVTAKGNPVKAKTLGQKRYVEAIRDNTVTVGVGPAGTGKTYLAVAMAVKAFRAKEVNRIILTRPAVEAGEKLGFLPGDLQSKVDPYLRPLYDALYQIMGAESFTRNMEKGLIEVAPLAYMRGRTLDNAFIILDEAQNTTPAQMKMFLTRLGFRSRMVITGDVTQIDLKIVPEKLFVNMLKADAEYLYSLPQWETILGEEKMAEIAKEYRASRTVRREGPKIGRNDPCPCGSGKKYKHCCGRNK